MGRSERSVASSPAASSKKARCCAMASASSPTRGASGRALDLPESDAELIDLAVERRQRQAEPIRGGPLVALGALQHRFDVHTLVRAQRLAEVVACARLR